MWEITRNRKNNTIGSKPGKLYGTVKVHKKGMSSRPVASMVGTPEYQLAKFSDNIIKPCIPDTYLLKSTEHFINEVRRCNFSKNKQLLVLMLY